ncbi:protein of unknown function [Alcaligenes faecalis subsp. faecalis]|nr:protein of unknown function [Alcaligenes faecalis subsp. faecalis]
MSLKQSERNTTRGPNTYVLHMGFTPKTGKYIASRSSMFIMDRGKTRRSYRLLTCILGA